MSHVMSLFLFLFITIYVLFFSFVSQLCRQKCGQLHQNHNILVRVLETTHKKKRIESVTFRHGTTR